MDHVGYTCVSNEERLSRDRLGTVGTLFVLVILLVVGHAPFAMATDASTGAKRPNSDGLVIDTAVGNGDGLEDSGDGGLAREAGLHKPAKVATGPDGTLYVWTEAGIRAIDQETQLIRTIDGTSVAGESNENGLAAAPDGTLFFTDSGNNRVQAVDPHTGAQRTVAGSGDEGFSGDGGPATEASLRNPKDVAVGADGTVYFIDTFNYRIRAIDPNTGDIRTVVGEANPGDEGAGFFPRPHDDEDNESSTDTFVEADAIVVGTDGRLYIAETRKYRVRAVDVARNTITTVAGEDGPVGTELGSPTDLSVGPDGSLYIAVNDSLISTRSSSSRVLMLDVTASRLTPFAGAADSSDMDSKESSLGDGADPNSVRIGRILGLSAAQDGRVYLVDESNSRVRVIGQPGESVPEAHPSAAKKIDTVAGSGRALSEGDKDAQLDEENGTFYRDVHERDGVDLDQPSSVTVDTDGTVFIADSGNNRIRAVDPNDGSVSTIAGKVIDDGSSGNQINDGTSATDVMLTKPDSLVLGADHTLYFLDSYMGSRVLAVNLDEGVIRVVAGSSSGLNNPRGLALGEDGFLYVADTGNLRICRVPQGGGPCATVAGGGEGGKGAHRQSMRPSALTIGPDGTIYAAEDLESRVVSVDPGTGQSTTIGGTSRENGPNHELSGDGMLATSAEMGVPSGLAMGRNGTLYVSDQANHRVRAIDVSKGTIQAVSGTGKFTGQAKVTPRIGSTYSGGGFSGDGDKAGDAQLNEPTGLATGPDGALYIADTGNNRIRAVGDVETPIGMVIHPIVYVGGGLVLVIGVGGVLFFRRRRARRKAAVEVSG